MICFNFIFKMAILFLKTMIESELLNYFSSKKTGVNILAIILFGIFIYSGNFYTTTKRFLYLGTSRSSS